MREIVLISKVKLIHMAKDRMAKEKYYKDNISENHNKDSAKWWKKINKLTGRDKSNNFSLTDPESQSITNDKDTANYIKSFFG